MDMCAMHSESNPTSSGKEKQLKQWLLTRVSVFKPTFQCSAMSEAQADNVGKPPVLMQYLEWSSKSKLLLPSFSNE